MDFQLLSVVELCTLICHKIHISQRLLFNNLSFPYVNHLKFIKHHTTQGKFKFDYYLFYCVRVIMHLGLIEKWQICGVHALNSVSFGQIYEVLVMPVLIPRLFPWKQGIHIILTHSSIFIFSVFNLWLYHTLYDDSFIYWLLTASKVISISPSLLSNTFVIVIPIPFSSFHVSYYVTL